MKGTKRKVLGFMMCVTVLSTNIVYADEQPSGSVQTHVTSPQYVPLPLPPAGFDPITASDADLEKYGFPSRPTDPQDLSAWKNAMQHFREMIKPVFGQSVSKTQVIQQTSSGATGSTTNRTWGGYEDRGSYNFSDVRGQFTVNPGYSDSQDGSHYAAWVGIGGDSYSGHSSPYVLQVGVDCSFYWLTATTTVTPFWEIGGYNSEQPISNLTVNPGDD